MNSENIIKDVNNYYNYLKNRIAFLENKLDKLPHSYLKVFTKNGHLFFYERSSGPNRTQKYIKKNNTEKLQPMINAYHIRKCLPILKQNLKAAKLFLDMHSHMEETTVSENTHEEIRKLNKNLFKDKESIITDWQNRPYKRNSYMDQYINISTVRGEMVRSKSEAIIANCLYSNNIPYKIECPLKLKQKTIYPDFTILNPNTLEEIYWEHFGKMSNDEYADNACQKICFYNESGIIIGKKLITTFESTGAPLSSNQVERIIKTFCK